MSIESISLDFETIIDIVVILVIIISTTYATRKRKKNNWEWNKYIEGKIWIDEQKWFVMKNNIQENIKKYQDIKWLIKAYLRIPGIIIWPFLIWFLLYNIIANQSEIEMRYYILTPVCCIFYILIFINTKKTLDKYENNFLYKILTIFGTMTILMIFITLWLLGGSIISNKLKLSYGLSSTIQIFSRFLSTILWLLFIWFIFKFRSSKNNSDKKIWDNKQINNKEIEEKSWYHQWPLLN